MDAPNERNWIGRIGLLLAALGGVAVLTLGYQFWRAERLASRFSQMHPDETEAKLLEVVGAPTEIRRCDEGRRKVQPSAVRPCARVYWYSTYAFQNIWQDGWIVPIDTQGTIMQIDRRGLP